MSNTKKNVGRPSGRKKTAKIEIAIEPEIKEEFMSICYSKGYVPSSQLYRYIREFISDNKKE